MNDTVTILLSERALPIEHINTMNFGGANAMGAAGNPGAGVDLMSWCVLDCIVSCCIILFYRTVECSFCFYAR